MEKGRREVGSLQSVSLSVAGNRERLIKKEAFDEPETTHRLKHSTYQSFNLAIASFWNNNSGKYDGIPNTLIS